MATFYYDTITGNSGRVAYQVYFKNSGQIVIKLWRFSETAYAMMAIKNPIGALNAWGLPQGISRKIFDEIINQWESNQPGVRSGPAQCSKCGIKNEYLTGPYICTGCKLWESVT